MTRDILVFDMDGVLVEVGDSYRETICQTVKHFTGTTIARDLVQEYKNQGGWNNDWLLSQKIVRDLGLDVPYQAVVDHFNRLFFGTVTDGIPDGLMARERWIAQPGALEDLNKQYRFSIFTGREREEAMMTLRRFANGMTFDPLVGADDVARGKPDPEGLYMIHNLFPDARLWYIGDTVDDARASLAAGVPFIGVAAPDVAFRDRLLALFRENRAVAVIDDINQLSSVLNQASG